MIIRVFILTQLVENILIDFLASDVILYQPLCHLKLSINLAFYSYFHIMFTSYVFFLFLECARTRMEKIFLIIISP